MPEHISNDLISIVERIVLERMKYVYRYTGIVKSIDTDGVAKVHSADFGTLDSDPSTWLYCQPGNRIKSMLFPDVDDTVEIYFPNGRPDLPRYSTLDFANITPPNSPSNSQVIYYNSDFTIYHDVDNSLLIIKGANSEEFAVLGETLKTELEKTQEQMAELKTAFTNWVPVPLDGGAALKAGLATFLTKPNANYSNILSSEVKNS